MSSTTKASASTVWEPTSLYQVTPTLIVLCGDPSGQLNSLRERVITRFAYGFPNYALQWTEASSENDISEPVIRRLVDPLLRFRQVWQRLEAEGFRDKMPAADEPFSIQVVVVCELMSGLEQLLEGSMEKLADRIRVVLGRRANCSFSLVVLGEGELDLSGQIPASYWPRFKLGTTMLGGVTATYAEMLDTCETLLVALLSSEVAESVSFQAASTSTSWIAVGASAVIADLPLMREYLSLLIYSSVMRPLLDTHISPVAASTGNHDPKDVVREFQSKIVGEALKPVAHKTFGWIHEQDPEEGRNLVLFQLDDASPLRHALSEPGPDFTARLADYYALVREAITNVLTSSRESRFMQLLKNLEGLGAGLATSLEIINQLVQSFKETPDLLAEGAIVEPYHMRSRGFLRSVAEEDALLISHDWRDYNRISRSVLSVLGAILMLIPALPLLREVLKAASLLLHNILQVPLLDDRQTLWYALGFLITIGLVDLVRTLIETANLLRRFHRTSSGVLKASVLHLIAGVIHDYRLETTRNLMLIASLLKKLRTRLVSETRHVDTRLGELEYAYAALKSQDVTSIFRLADLDQPREWADRAIRRAEETDFSGFAGSLITDYLSHILRTSPQSNDWFVSYIHVMRQIGQRIDRLVSDSFLLQPTPALLNLVQDTSQLGQGKMWGWLYQRAHPFGSGGRPLTIILLRDSALLEGGYGRSNPGWSPDAIVGRATLPHEIICIRGICT